MSTYHVVTFDDSIAAHSLNRDLTTLEVKGVEFTQVGDEFRIAVPVPTRPTSDGGTVADHDHKRALAALAFGRGPFTITRETR